MKPFDIFITYISWGAGGKNRPVLVFVLNNNMVEFFPITTQYSNKSKAIRTNYFEIEDWKQAGLSKPSYVDTGTLLSASILILKNNKAIGKLTNNDKERLLSFLNS